MTRPLTFIAACTLSLGVSLGLPTLGQAQHAVAPPSGEAVPDYFENEVFHFVLPNSVFVTSNRVSAPEGPVDVITVRPSDERMGAIEGSSFISFTVFHNALPGEGSQPQQARDLIVDGVRAALSGANISERTGSVDLDGHAAETRVLNIAFGGAEASSMAAGLEQDGVAVVFYDQRARSDAARFVDLDTVRDTFAFGAPPEPDEAEEGHADESHGNDDHADDEHADEEHADEEHGDDEHGHGHDDHAH